MFSRACNFAQDQCNFDQKIRRIEGWRVRERKGDSLSDPHQVLRKTPVSEEIVNEQARRGV
jgi:hypothetical protein